MIRNLKKAALLIIMVLSVVVSFTACQLPPEILAMLGLSAAPQDEGMKLETAYVMAKAAGFTESEEAFYDQMAGNYYSVAGQVGVKNSQIEGGKFVITLTNGAKIDYNKHHHMDGFLSFLVSAHQSMSLPFHMFHRMCM